MNPNDPLSEHEVPPTFAADDREDQDTPDPFGTAGNGRDAAGGNRRRARLGALEALVAGCIVVALAGVTMPIVGEEVIAARHEQAVLDMQQIVNGLRAYSQDTLTLPTGERGRTDVTWLYGPGIVPEANPFDDGGQGRGLHDVLLTDAMGGPGWDGPYAPGLAPDPWGGAYLVNVDGLIDRRERAMVLSAGPDGICQTSATAREAGGDDILLPVN